MGRELTANMKFNTSVMSMANVQSQYNSVMEQMASQKRINRISDDPLGMTQLLDYRQGQASIEQYQKNIDNSSAWLSMTEAKLNGAGDLLSQARELAVGQGTATATAETRRIAADNVEQLKNEMLSLANSTYNNKYLFSGSRMATAPFTATTQPARIDTPVAGASNSYDGAVTASGPYTAAVNKTYVVKIVAGGPLATATYQISADGGKTWGSASNAGDLAAGTIALGDGISLTFAGGSSNLAAGDLVKVDAHAPGYYQGNSADLTTDIGQGVVISYNTHGTAAFGGGSGGTDVLKTLDDLKTALTNNDQAGILAQLDNLKMASDQVSATTAKVGNTMNRLDLAKGNLQALSQQLTDLSSKTADVDIAALSTKLAMQQLALQASYTVAAKMGDNTILNFIK